MPESQRQALQQRCAESGIAALSWAVALGYDNVRRQEGDAREAGMLWNLRFDPAFPKLIEAMKAKQTGR